MIIERWKHKIKAGHLEEAKNLIFSVDWARPFRLFEFEIGVLYRLTADIEFAEQVNLRVSRVEANIQPSSCLLLPKKPFKVAPN